MPVKFVPVGMWESLPLQEWMVLLLLVSTQFIKRTSYLIPWNALKIPIQFKSSTYLNNSLNMVMPIWYSIFEYPEKLDYIFPILGAATNVKTATNSRDACRLQIVVLVDPKVISTSYLFLKALSFITKVHFVFTSKLITYFLSCNILTFEN